MYPNPKLTTLSRYSHEDICETLDQWYETEKRFNALIQSLPENFVLPSDLQEELTWLEPVMWHDGEHHSAGSSEHYPVAKWKKLIKQHNKLARRIAEYFQK